VHGSCACGGVAFEVDAPFLRWTTCHCTLCRKHSGTFGAQTLRAARDSFRLLAGEELLTIYDPGEGHAKKVFCSRCGSSLFGGRWPEGDEISIRAGAIDGDPGLRPQLHIFVESRAPWDELPDDGLPRHADLP
jgi:hypothetical protein